MQRRIVGIVLSAILFALSFPVEAQQTKVPRIGYLSNRIKPTPTMPDLFENAFRQGLRDLGYVEGEKHPG
jgi:hypothetical protein